MRYISALLFMIKISYMTAELCSEYSLVFKYKEPLPGQQFWEPLQPVDKESPQLKELFEKNKECTLELDCGGSVNLTNIITFATENPNIANDNNKNVSNDGVCPVGKSGENCKSQTNAPKGTFLDCDAIDKNNKTKPIEIEVIPDDQCNDDCYILSWTDATCTDNVTGCRDGSNDLTPLDPIPPESTEKSKIDNTPVVVAAGNAGAVGSEKNETNMTALIVISALLGLIAGSALLFFGAKTAIAYFKSKSYNIGEAEADRNEQNIELGQKCD